jgi:ribosome-interacting GTPase 1
MDEKDTAVQIPDLPGLIFKDMTLKANANDLMGKYVVGFAKNGKKIIKLLEYDDKTNKLTYEVYSGLEEQKGKKFKALVEDEMPFYAYAEDALVYAMINS